MNIDIEETVSDEYELVGNDGLYGTFDTIDKAIRYMETYRPDYVRCHDMKIRHRLTAYIDKTVDCSELLKENG